MANGIVKLQNTLKKFHEDEDGMAVIESVLILAIAAGLGIGLYWLFTKATVGDEEGGILWVLGDWCKTLFSTVGDLVTSTLLIG